MRTLKLGDFDKNPALNLRFSKDQSLPWATYVAVLDRQTDHCYSAVT